MDAPSVNPLVSSQKSSQLQAILHPLVLLTISDYITRHTLREMKGPIIGALLGQQNGREITIEHAFECHTRIPEQVEEVEEAGFLIDAAWFGARLEQMVAVHKERQLDLVGWYTLCPATGPSPVILRIHNQILENWNQSAILLGFHPEEVMNHSVGGKLPLTIYESNYEVDDTKTITTDAAAAVEDRKMDDGESTTLKLKFREVPYSVETDETEMISMNYIAESGGSAAVAPAKEERPTRSIESNGKGKRRLVEAEVEDATGSDTEEDIEFLSREEQEMLASLTAKSNAIRMLFSRIKLIITYLERLPPSFTGGGALDAKTQAETESMETDNTTPSLTILRHIQALVSRLGLVIPSDAEAFDREVQCETNNVHLVGLLNSIIQGVNEARDVGKKFNAIESGKPSGRRGNPDFGGGLPFNMAAGTGDMII